MLSLRKIVLFQTGEDLRQCRGCAFCDNLLGDDMDISISSLVQLVILNDEEVLTSRTLWNERILEEVNASCSAVINMNKVLLALREEAKSRGLTG